MKVVFAGSGEFGVPALTALLDAGHEAVCVVSQPDRPAGRGRQLTPTPISEIAVARNLNLLRTANLNAEPLPAADLLVVIAFGQKISDAFIDRFPLRAVNLHASLLPKFRGAAPVNAAILAGESVTGNSIIRLAQRMDAGAVLAQSRLEIDPLETAGELHDRLALDGGPLLLKTIAELADGSAVERQQDEAGASRAPKMSRAAAQLDWRLPARDLARQIRGMHPWPGCQVELLDRAGAVTATVTLARARALAGASEMIGQVLPDGSIGTGDGTLEILDLQPKGKKPMPLRAFQNGNAWDGLTLRSL